MVLHEPLGSAQYYGRGFHQHDHLLCADPLGIGDGQDIPDLSSSLMRCY